METTALAIYILVVLIDMCYIGPTQKNWKKDSIFGFFKSSSFRELPIPLSMKPYRYYKVQKRKEKISSTYYLLTTKIPL